MAQLPTDGIVAGSARGIALDCAFTAILIFFDGVVVLAIGHFPIMN